MKGRSKRNPAMLEQDRRIIAKLLYEGYNSSEITEIINEGRHEHLQVSKTTIEHDIAVLFERWKNSGLVDINEQRNRILAELNHLKKIYYKEFYDSKNPKKTITTEALADEEGMRELKENDLSFDENTLAQITRVTVKEEHSGGNPAYLKGVETVIEKEIKMFGFDVNKISFTDSDGQSVSSAGEYVKALLDKMADNSSNPLELPPSNETEEREDEDDFLEAEFTEVEESND